MCTDRKRERCRLPTRRPYVPLCSAGSKPTLRMNPRHGVTPAVNVRRCTLNQNSGRHVMRSSFAISAVIIAALISGCQSQQQMVDEMQADATQVAKQRGKFELNCPTAT